MKNIFGIKPEMYLIYAYAVLIILVLLAIILLPGILKNGAYMEIWANVEGAEFLVDGKRIGSVPGMHFVTRGTHTFRVHKDGFLPYSEEHTVRGRLFFSLFFPRRSNIIIWLKADNSLSAEEFAKPVLLNLSSWGFQSASAARQVAPFFDDYALSSLSRGDAGMEHIPPALIGSDQHLRDILRGLSRIQSSSIVPNSFGLSKLLNTAMSNLDSSTYNTVEKILAPAVDVTILGQASPLSDRAPNVDSAHALRSTVNRSQILTQLQARGYTGSLIEQGGVFVMDSPVNYAFFQSFISENDVWKEDNFHNLEEMGLTSANLFMHDPLENPVNSKGPDPVRSINLLAVFSFIDWLSQTMEGISIRLPHPSELSEEIFETATLWEYSSQYAHSHQTAWYTEPALSIEPQEMRGLQNGLIAGNGRELWHQTFLTSTVQVQNSGGETGILTPTMVSPVTTFRLLFEGK